MDGQDSPTTHAPEAPAPATDATAVSVAAAALLNDDNNTADNDQASSPTLEALPAPAAACSPAAPESPVAAAADEGMGAAADEDMGAMQMPMPMPMPSAQSVMVPQASEPMAAPAPLLAAVADEEENEEEGESEHVAEDSDEELEENILPPLDTTVAAPSPALAAALAAPAVPAIIVVHATEEPTSPLSPQHPANRTVGPMEDVSLHGDDTASPTKAVLPTASAAAAGAVPAPTTRAALPPAPTSAAPRLPQAAAQPFPTTAAVEAGVPLPRMAPPARTHAALPPGPVPAKLAAAKKANLGVVIVGKPAQASAARKKLAMGFMHNLKYEYYLGRVRLQGHVSTPASAAEDAAMTQQMETLKSVDTCYVRLSEIATNYKKSMDEFKEAELALAKFLDESAMRDATPVGDVMRSLASAMKGQATHHSTKLAGPMTSLVDDFRTFNTRVVADTSTTIARMDRARLESDAYNLWLKDVDSERARNTEKFQTVQHCAATAQQSYDRLRHDCMTKIMMVGDHRLRMTSTTLRRYHGALASHYAHSADQFRNAVVRHKDMAGADSFRAILAEG